MAQQRAGPEARQGKEQEFGVSLPSRSTEGGILNLCRDLVSGDLN